VHDAAGFHGTNLKLQPGSNVHIDGNTALKLMRARYGIDGGGDLPRIKRQQTFMSAMIRKATATSLLTSPIDLQNFLNATVSSLTTDGFGLRTMHTLADALHREGAGKVRLLTVPNYAPPPGSPLYGDVVWQQQKADELWQALLHDKPIAKKTGKGGHHNRLPSEDAAKQSCLS
jgi:anionic cell wall polymer biosynthesis LytR-Cps2A-Psr (LCP) family protein